MDCNSSSTWSDNNNGDVWFKVIIRRNTLKSEIGQCLTEVRSASFFTSRDSGSEGKRDSSAIGGDSIANNKILSRLPCVAK